jgi:hypothetical protein
MAWIEKQGLSKKEIELLQALDKEILGIEEEDKVKLGMFQKQIETLEFLRKNIVEIEQFIQQSKEGGHKEYFDKNFPKIKERMDYIKKVVLTLKENEKTETKKEIKFIEQLESLIKQAEQNLIKIGQTPEW